MTNTAYTSVLSKNETNIPHSKYRPDIDGLRAVAVFSVVGFHIFPTWVKSGFIGVDIFFVISGFLISTIIFRRLEQHNFSLFEFYERRIRRIFPTLLIILITSYIFGWFGLLADEYKQLGKHIAGGAGFHSNFILWQESGYFDNSAETKPLLHLWSLGIEEQFYIAWPLLLWIIWKKRLNIPVILAAIILISFALNVVKIQSDPIGAFYSPQTRFWELLSGSSLAYIFLHGRGIYDKVWMPFNLWPASLLYARWPSFKNYYHQDNFLATLGVAFLVIGFAMITSANYFPGWWAIFPIAGTLLIISAGPHAWLNRVVLANRILVWFGLISFPLYLWHWPILAFARIVEGRIDLSREIRISVIIVSIALAWITYKLIERPIRFGAHGRIKVITLLALMVITGYLGNYCYRMDGFESRIAQKNIRQQPLITGHELRMLADRYKQSSVYTELFSQMMPPDDGNLFFSYNSNETDRIKIAIIGDSHAWKLYGGLIQFTKDSVINIGRGSCPPFLDVDSENSSPNFKTQLLCQPLVNNYLKYLKDNEHVEIIIVNAFYKKFNRDVMLKSAGQRVELNDSIIRTIDFLSNSNKIIILALDVPEVPISCYKYKKRNIPVWALRESEGVDCTIDEREYFSQNTQIINSVKFLQDKRKNVLIYNPSHLFCKNHQCGEVNADKFLYGTDGNHLNSYGIKMIGQDLSTFLNEVVAK